MGRHCSSPTNCEVMLPRDITGLIIDQLAADRQSLYSCSLVGTSWYPRTRKHLFHQLQLHVCEEAGPTAKLNGLLLLLQANAALASYILSIRLRFKSPYAPPRDVIPTDQQKVATEGSSLPSLLPLLTSLRDVSIHPYCSLNWGDLDSETRASIYSCISKVHTIRLHNICNFQVTPLTSYIPLRSLVLHRVSVSLTEIEAPFPLPCPPPSNPGVRTQALCSLSLHESDTAMRVLLASHEIIRDRRQAGFLDFSRPTAVSLGVCGRNGSSKEGSFVDLGTLVQGFASSLRSLCFDVDESEGGAKCTQYILDYRGFRS
ncbi:hypothetical protein FA15DRAFT_304786 [Coprinopsis marcescibilis]|uniref:F-box domain-containing protein n=1 Tax=Coprinopsis marcescibilis TaxID=230819 RepID=A0A5C3L107_COPMA|nr:hypothetical protein FA15DRAFT_304786 [Coprinopsis marcescibilis]